MYLYWMSLCKKRSDVYISCFKATTLLRSTNSTRNSSNLVVAVSMSDHHELCQLLPTDGEFWLLRVTISGCVFLSYSHYSHLKRIHMVRISLSKWTKGFQSKFIVLTIQCYHSIIWNYAVYSFRNGIDFDALLDLIADWLKSWFFYSCKSIRSLISWKMQFNTFNMDFFHPFWMVAKLYEK